MTSIQREIVFIDRNVTDLTTLLAVLRSDVEPILLSADAPAPQQIAEAVNIAQTSPPFTLSPTARRGR